MSEQSPKTRKNNSNKGVIAANIVKVTYFLWLTGFSWIVVCGIHKSVALFCKTNFNWADATGIWIGLSIIFLIRKWIWRKSFTK